MVSTRITPPPIASRSAEQRHSLISSAGDVATLATAAVFAAAVGATVRVARLFGIKLP